MPASNVFEFRKGEDAVIHYTLRQSSSSTAPVVDLTGALLSFKVKRTKADADPSLVSANVSIINAPAGLVDVTLTAADLSTLDGDYRHSLWRTNVGAKACFDDGHFSVIDTVES